MTFALFGEKKFGEFQFGAGSFTHPKFALEIDWDNDGFFDGRNDGLLLNSLRIKRGKRYIIRPSGEGFEEDETGQMIGTLLDIDDWYDPFVNTDIGAGKYFRLRVRTPSDQLFPIIAGKISEPVITEGRGVRRVQLMGDDGWGTLRDQRNRVNIALQEDIYGDTAMNLLLDAIGWPSTWGRDIDDGEDLHQYWWADNKSAATALFDLAYSEMGRLWIAGDGKITFRNRHYVDASLFTVTDDDVYLGSLKVLEPWDVVRNSIRVTAKQREVVPDVQLWQALDVLRLTAGEARSDIFAEFTYNANSVQATNIIQPVPYVDYEANTNTDGTGVDLTPFWSVIAYPFSTAANMVVANNGSLAGYLLMNKLRGDALTTQSQTTESNDTASQKLYGIRSLDLTYEWIQNMPAARAIARHLKNKLAFPKKYISFDIKDNPDKQFALNLGTQVDVNITSKGISGTYRVYYFEHQWADAAGLATRTTVVMEPVDVALGDYWIVPSQVPMKVPF